MATMVPTPTGRVNAKERRYLMELSRFEITQRRERLGLSKSAFGRESGLHVSTISQIENGHLVPYPGQVKKMLSAFERLEAKERLQKAAL